MAIEAMTAGLDGAVGLQVTRGALAFGAWHATRALDLCWLSFGGLVQDTYLALLDESACSDSSGLVDESLLTQSIPFLLSAGVEDVSGLRASERANILAEARDVSVYRSER